MKNQSNICGIYMIEALAGNPERVGWKYIGQSANCLKRWKRHLSELSKGKHINFQLQSIYNKYGKDALSFSVIQEADKGELNFWEKWFIKSFDSYKNGLNRTEGGENPPDNSEKQRSNGVLVNIYTGKRIEFKGFSKFAQENQLNQSDISHLFSGKRSVCKGWMLPENAAKKKPFKVMNSSGICFSGFGVSKFSKEHGIRNRRNFASVISGKAKSCEGWTLCKETI